MKYLVFFIILVLSLAILPSQSLVKAQSPLPSVSESPANVDSYALFWPLVPGKTMDNSLYFLKVLKEKVRGALIFGSAQKADYKTFLATKRALEAGDLVKRSKPDLADKTLVEFSADIDSASEFWQDAKNKSDVPDSTKENITKQLNNLDIYLKWLLINNEGNIKNKIGESHTKVQNFLESL